MHFIIGRREEDVIRTGKQEGDEYQVYYFNKRQDLHMKLDEMGRRETLYKKKEMLDPTYFERMKESGCETEIIQAIEERERWKRYNQNYYYNIQEQKRKDTKS